MLDLLKLVDAIRNQKVANTATKASKNSDINSIFADAVAPAKEDGEISTSGLNFDGEKSRIQSENSRILSDALSELVDTIKSDVDTQKQIVKKQLDKTVFDQGGVNIASLVKLPAASGVNGGSASFSIGNLSNSGISINANLSDSIEALIHNKLGIRFSDATNVVSTAAISIPIDENTMKEAVLESLASSNPGMGSPMDAIANLQPGGMAVLAWEVKGNSMKKAVWVMKSDDGKKANLFIDKSGIKLNLTFNTDDFSDKGYELNNKEIREKLENPKKAEEEGKTSNQTIEDKLPELKIEDIFSNPATKI